MKMLGDRQRHLLRRGATGAALLLAGLLAVVLLIVATGSIVINALDPLDPIDVSKDLMPFGVVLPGEAYPDDFEICIKDPASGDQVDYTLTLIPKGSLPDMTPYLDVVRDPLESTEAADTMASAALDEDAGDRCDNWLITLTAPHCEGAYNPATDPQGNGATIHCDVDHPTADPQTWSEGSDLGAKLEISVTRTVPAP